METCLSIIGCLIAASGAPAPSGPAGTTFFAWTNEHRTIRAMVLRCQPLAELQALPQVNLPADSCQGCAIRVRLLRGMLRGEQPSDGTYGALVASTKFSFYLRGRRGKIVGAVLFLHPFCNSQQMHNSSPPSTASVLPSVLLKQHATLPERNLLFMATATLRPTPDSTMDCSDGRLSRRSRMRLLLMVAAAWALRMVVVAAVFRDVCRPGAALRAASATKWAGSRAPSRSIRVSPRRSSRSPGPRRCCRRSIHIFSRSSLGYSASTR